MLTCLQHIYNKRNKPRNSRHLCSKGLICQLALNMPSDKILAALTNSPLHGSTGPCRSPAAGRRNITYFTKRNHFLFNGSWTEWSVIWSEIIHVILKLDERAVWFETNTERQEVQLPLYYSRFKIAEFSQHQCLVDLVANLLKSETKRLFSTSHFVFVTEMMWYRAKMVRFRTEMMIVIENMDDAI